MSQLPMPEGDSSYMEDNKEYPYGNHQKQKSKHFCSLPLGIRVTKKSQQSQALDEATLHLHREKTTRSASVVGNSPLWPVGPSQ